MLAQICAAFYRQTPESGEKVYRKIHDDFRLSGSNTYNPSIHTADTFQITDKNLQIPLSGFSVNQTIFLKWRMKHGDTEFVS